MTKLAPDATIHWIARAGGAQSPTARAGRAQVDQRVQQIGHELTEVDLGLTLSFDPPEKARLLEQQQALREELTYLEQRARDLNFGDAMLDRNIDPEGPLSNPNITRFVKAIDTIEPVRTDDVLRARVRFSDGTEDTYDQVIVNHGADNNVPGSPGALAEYEKLQRRQDRDARASGECGWCGQGCWCSVVRRRGNSSRLQGDVVQGRTRRFETDAGVDRQPSYSRDVPSFHWASEQITR